MRRPIARQAALLIAPLAVLSAACTASSSPSSSSSPSPKTAHAAPPAGRGEASDAADAGCRVTPPVPAASVPAALRDWGAGQQWYGDGDLWVAKPGVQGPWDSAGGGYRTKYASVTLDAHGAVTDRKGPPVVRAERLDGSASVIADTGGFATADGGKHWWPTGVALPQDGCWKVTETLGSTSVDFVIRVPAADPRL